MARTSPRNPARSSSTGDDSIPATASRIVSTTALGSWSRLRSAGRAWRAACCVSGHRRAATRGTSSIRSGSLRAASSATASDRTSSVGSASARRTTLGGTVSGRVCNVRMAKTRMSRSGSDTSRPTISTSSSTSPRDATSMSAARRSAASSERNLAPVGVGGVSGTSIGAAATAGS